MKLLILTEDDVRGLVNMAEAIDLQAKAFAILAAGGSVEGLRSFVKSDDPPGAAIFNPSFLKGGKGYGIKVVSDFYGNPARGVPRMSAIVALFDGETGLPRTLMEAGHMSDLRTGAGTALAARHLARPDSRVLTLIGAGRVARNQLAALAEVCPLEKVWVSTRSEARGREFVERMAVAGGRVPTDIEVAEDREAAVRAADIVVCATTARQPTFDGAQLGPGTFVAAVGAHDIGAREVDSETIRRAARRVIDSPVDCLKNAGDLMVPIGGGIIGEADIAGIADVAAGRRPGRQSVDEITYYKSMGVPIQDLVTAQFIETRAIERGTGTRIDIGGDHD